MRRTTLSDTKNIDPSSDSEEDDFSDQSEGDVPEATPRSKGKARAFDIAQDQPHAGLIVQTAFDAYFTQASSRSQTSSNVFSSLVPPLTADEYSEAIQSCTTELKPIQPIILSESSRRSLFTRFSRELDAGFNLIFYGFGSKREILNQFATDHCSKVGHVVVVNGFQPDFTLKDLFNSIENVPGVLSLEISSTTVENQAKRVYDFFAQPEQKQPLFIIIHNIDAPALRASKAKSCLAVLALNPRIHIVASIDHINAPLLWSSSEISTRKQDDSSQGIAPARGFAWLWHDLTTLAPYDFELAFADRTSLSGAHGGGAHKKHDAMAMQSATAMSETAALHILASVTQKAKKLFSLIGEQQLGSIEEAEDPSSTDLQQFALGYDMLFNAARDNFIATNDTALRSLLGEFRDHGLVVGSQAGSGGGEVLWIPLRKERLTSVLRSIQTEQ